MADVTMTQDKYDVLVKRAEAADAAAKEILEKNLSDHKAQAKLLQDANDKLTTDLTKATETLKKVNDELTASQAISKANEDKSLAFSTQIKDLEAKLVEAKAAMDKHAKDSKLVARKAACADLDMDETKANEFLAKFADINDDLFGEVVKAMPKKTAQTNKDVLANAQLTTATVTIPSETQKLLSAKASEWISGSLILETKQK